MAGLLEVARRGVKHALKHTHSPTTTGSEEVISFFEQDPRLRGEPFGEEKRRAKGVEAPKK